MKLVECKSGCTEEGGKEGRKLSTIELLHCKAACNGMSNLLCANILLQPHNEQNPKDNSRQDATD